jgi:hypothetical protein
MSSAVAEFVQLLHHVAETVAVYVRRRHVQVFHHLLELLQQLARRVRFPKLNAGRCLMGTA